MKTHIIAGKLIEVGADFGTINRAMFETKTKAKLALERMVYDTLDYHCNGQCAIIYTTLAMQEKLNLGDDQMEGLASIPRQIEGVRIGITMREKQNNQFKISVRTNGDTDACLFCQRFGGGGHKAASGCTIEGDLATVKAMLINEAKEILK
jgi:phosphoesterase RecJ-like protein